MTNKLLDLIAEQVVDAQQQAYDIRYLEEEINRLKEIQDDIELKRETISISVKQGYREPFDLFLSSAREMTHSGWERAQMQNVISIRVQEYEKRLAKGKERFAAMKINTEFDNKDKSTE